MASSLFDLTGKTAVVVGGTSGIGLAMAVGLAEAGADVVASSRRQEQVDEAAAQIEAKGRKAAIREFDQKAIDQSFVDCDILTNCRQYPKDEAPAAYKDFEEVLRSVTGAGLASEVARLRARFVIKDADKADD